MRKLAWLLIVILTIKSLKAQRTLLTNNMTGYVCYLGMSNPLNILVENANCDKVFLKSNNGEIIKKKNCYYYFKPQKTGRATVSVYIKKKNKLKLICDYNFDVKYLPKPNVYIGAYKSGDSVCKNCLLAQSYLRTNLSELFDFAERNDLYLYSIKQHKIVVKRQDSTLYSKTIDGFSFTDESKNFFYNLQPFDKVIFTNILYSDRNIYLNPVELIIK